MLKSSIGITFMRMLVMQTYHLFRRELLLEQRRRYALFGVLLYVVSTVFICRFSFLTIRDVTTWNALFWIIMLFASVTAVARSFAQESTGHQLYLYTLASPLALLLAKLVYNTLLMIGLGLVGLGIFGFLVGYPVGNTALFLIVLILGCTGLSACFTMISAIAAKAGQNFTLMAILGFPLVLPLLLLIIRLSKYAIDDLGWNLAWSYIGMITLLNLIVVTLSCILFPYLWRD